ncbi:MAG: TonB family protein [Bacteroidota bacterium]
MIFRFKKSTLLFLVSIHTVGGVWSQIQKENLVWDTLYYTSNWRISGEGNYAYYRIASFNPKEKYFLGVFMDYYASGGLFESGDYDDLGNKSGNFKRYYENGNLYSEGNFENNLMLGNWSFYYENGKLKEVITFSESDYAVLESYGVLGKQTVKNGTGKWKHNVRIPGTEGAFLVGKFENGMKKGKWVVKDQKHRILMQEVYEGGKFRIGLTNFDGRNDRYLTSIITREKFIPSNHAIKEKFKINPWVTQLSYPYFEDLPKDNAQRKKVKENRKPGSIPNPVGGIRKFYQSISKRLKYPSEAVKKRIEGKVTVAFSVEKDGTLTNFEIVQGLGYGCDENAISAIKEGPRWNPAIIDGDTLVKSLLVPITFKLGSSKSSLSGDEVFTLVQNDARPTVGMIQYEQYLRENLVNPKEAKDNRIKGRVFVQFIVEKDGTLSNWKIIRGLGYGCDKEAIRLLKEGPAWSPGLHRGKAVRQKKIQVVEFN